MSELGTISVRTGYMPHTAYTKIEMTWKCQIGGRLHVRMEGLVPWYVLRQVK
jgi:hypothetical protein